MDVPLLIGGATTSRKHTAVKIWPQYEASERIGDQVCRREFMLSRISGCALGLSAGGRCCSRIGCEPECGSCEQSHPEPRETGESSGTGLGRGDVGSVGKYAHAQVHMSVTK